METVYFRTIISQIRHVSRLHRCIIEKKVRNFRLHRSQHMILRYLSRTEVPPSQKEIAERFEISPSAVAITIKKMENMELIQRVVSPSDSRVNLIILSEKGKQVLAETQVLFDDVDRAMIAGITREEMEQLSVILEKVETNLQRMDAEP